MTKCRYERYGSCGGEGTHRVTQWTVGGADNISAPFHWAPKRHSQLMCARHAEIVEDACLARGLECEVVVIAKLKERDPMPPSTNQLMHEHFARGW